MWWIASFATVTFLLALVPSRETTSLYSARSAMSTGDTVLAKSSSASPATCWQPRTATLPSTGECSEAFAMPPAEKSRSHAPSLDEFPALRRLGCSLIEADCRSTIGQRTRFFHFATLDELRAFVTRCHPNGANLENFENNVRAWSRGSIYVNLSDEQYAKLKS
jgi:hypothetical protein